MPKLSSYDQIESKLRFLVTKTGLRNEDMVQGIANIAMKTVTDELQTLYEVMLEHCATIDPASEIRNEIRELRNELINKLLK